MRGSGTYQITLNKVPKHLPPGKEKESRTGVFIILSTLLSFPCFFRVGNTCTQLLPGNYTDNAHGVGSLRKKCGLQVQKVTVSPVVLGQLNHSFSLLRVRSQTPKDKADEPWDSSWGMPGVWCLLTHLCAQLVQNWHIPGSGVPGDFCIAEMDFIPSEGKTGLENHSAYFIIYFLVILLTSIHQFDGGFVFLSLFLFFFSF